MALSILMLMAFKGGEEKKVIVAQGDNNELVDCLVKYRTKWGETCSQCGNSPDTYVAYLKNTCSKKLDVMIGVQEESKMLRLSTFYGIAPNDSVRAYACKGTGKIYKWVREAGDKSYAFPTQKEANDFVNSPK
ncbi:MAG: hypothetical protein IT235_02175 [Bacteroidia bacterium]|nr:hypothetical protein [Bacteroidia bacterium]